MLLPGFFKVSAAAAVVATAAYAAVIWFEVGGDRAVVAVDDLGSGLAALLAAGACAWSAYRSTGQFRRAWGLLAVSAAAWCAGELTWSYYEVGLGITPGSPSLPDAGYLAAIPFEVAGLLSFWTAPRGTATRWRVWLDGIVIVCSLVFAAWTLGLKLLVTSPADSPAARAVIGAYPAADILVITLILLAIRRADRVRQGPLVLLLGGLAALALSDSYFAYMNGSYSGIELLMDSGWFAGYLMIGLAALWPSQHRETAAERRSIDLWQVALPWLAVLVAAIAAVIATLRGETPDAFMTLLVSGLAVMLMLSQILSTNDARILLARSQESERLLTEMVAHARRGIARTDRNSVIIGGNDGLGDLFGVPTSTMIGTRIGQYIAGDVEAEAQSKIEMLMAGAADSVEMQFPARRPDGGTLWLGATGYAISNSKGEIECVLAYLEDLTAKHAAEESARSSLRLLEHLNQVKSDFIQSVSHEFKTGLVGIQGFGELLRGLGDLSAEASEYADDIVSGAEDLGQLITEMVDLYNAQVTSGALSIADVDVNEIVRSVVAGFGPQAHGVALTTDLEAGLPRVSGDAGRLAEAVSALVRNALAHSPEGREVSVTTCTSLGQVMVTVVDRGVGMRSDVDNPLFDQGDLYANSPIRKVVGTSLGLGIARQIVDLHGGRLWAEHLETSTANHFTLPASSQPRPTVSLTRMSAGAPA